MKSNVCTVCFKEGETHLHHIVPRKQGGPDTLNNLIELCLACHAKAHFERADWQKRQRAGIERAKMEGKYLGRKPTARNKTDDVMRLIKEGFKPFDIWKKLNISKTSYYRILKHGVREED